MIEEVINERHEGYGEDRFIFVLLLFKIGQDCFVFDIDGPDFFPLAENFLQLIYLYFSLLHAFHYNQW